MNNFISILSIRKKLTAKLVLVLLTFLCCNGFAQKKLSAEMGFYSGFIISPAEGPNFCYTPNVAFSYNRLQFGVGLDIYNTHHRLPNIYGVTASGKLFLRPLEKRNNWFTNNYFQYIKYATGALPPVPYNYLSPWWEDININQIKSFSHFLTFGYQVRFLWLCHFQIEAGGGYNYYDRKVTPPGHGQTYSSNPWPAEKKIVPIAFIKLGLSFRLWKNY